MSAYDFLELDAQTKAKEQALPMVEASMLSIAISLRRVADALTARNNLSQCVDTSSYPPAFRTKSG
jgi:hypothetical protein